MDFTSSDEREVADGSTPPLNSPPPAIMGANNPIAEEPAKIRLFLNEGSNSISCDFCGELVYKSISTRVYREIRTEQSTAQSEADDGTRAVKCLAEENPSLFNVSSLNNEYNILSRRLRDCPGARGIVTKAKLDGLDAIVMEWVNGLTLNEWIAANPPRCTMTREDALKRIAIAHAIASALAEIHECGVIHNDIVAENIIVSKEVKDSSFTAKIIDFGFASLSQLNEMADEGERVNDDLYSLGLILRDMFTLGEAESIKLPNDLPGCKKISLRSSIHSFATTDSLGLHSMENNADVAMPVNFPHSLATLLTNLMETAHLDPYESTRDLADDLQQMLENPDIFLFDPPQESIDQLQCVPCRLQGRADEIASLMNAYNRILDPTHGRAEVVLVAGQAGTGKSTLVRQVFSPNTMNCGYFIAGKFDQMHRSEPYSAFVFAFNELCELILGQDTDSIKAIRNEIVTAIGSQGVVLTELIPRLTSIIGKQLPVARATGKESQNRFNYVTRMFTKAISTPEHPVVLFLDDLQWADAASLELIKTLSTDDSNSNMLFVGCYRDDEVPHSHPFAAQVRAMEAMKVPITRIKIGNLSQLSTNQFISESLRLPRRLTQPLTTIVYRKTFGNAFFVVHFLRSLCDEGLLYFSREFVRWMWNAEEARTKSLCDNVVELMTDKILKLPAELQEVLKVAASVGAHFGENTIEHIILKRTSGSGRERNAIDVKKILCSLSEEDLIDPLRDGLSYKFSHDRIQQAAYSLLLPEERNMLHLVIGRNLLNRAESAGTDADIFAAADQMNRGRAALVDSEGQLKLSEINLQAGRKAAASSAFVPAAAYFKTGIELLGNSRWDCQRYNLSLELLSNLAEMEYCNGNFEETEKLAKEIFFHGKSFSDKFLAYMSLIKSAGAQGETRQALKIGLEVLAHLGEPLPGSVTKTVIIRELTKTKLLIWGKSDKYFSMLAGMKDASKINAMQVLSLMFAYAYLVKKEYVPIVAFRMMQISVRYGACRETAFAYSIYGLILSGVLGDVSGGHRFGRLALTLLDRFDAKEWFAHVYALVFYGIMHRCEHLSMTLEPLLRGYRVGLEAGDNEYSMHCAYDFASHSFQVGRSLKSLEEDMRAFCLQMTEYKQDTVRALTAPFWQCVLNLMGRSENLLELTGEAMDQDQLILESTQAGHDLVLAEIYINRMMLAYLFCDYELAREMSKNSKNAAKVAPGLHLVCVQAFYHSLTLIALARQSNRQNAGRRAHKIAKSMRKWAKHSPGNCLHKSLLLKAELLSLKKNMRATKSAYEEAISAATSSGFVHEAALVYERAGTFYLGLGEQILASQHLARAHHLYLEWGATAKADALNTDFTSLVSPARRRRSFGSFIRRCGAQATVGPDVKTNTSPGAAGIMLHHRPTLSDWTSNVASSVCDDHTNKASSSG